MDILESLLRSYGYWFLFLGAFVEGETVVLAAGFVAYLGYLNIHLVVAVTFIGAFAGDQLYFRLGRWKGAGLLERYSLWRENVEKVRYLLQRYGLFVVLGFRFIYGARTVTPFVIGSSGFDPTAFFMLDGISAFAWSCVVTYAGYVFGAVVQVLFAHVRKAEHIIVLVLLCAGAATWIFNVLRKWRAGRKKA